MDGGFPGRGAVLAVNFWVPALGLALVGGLGYAVMGRVAPPSLAVMVGVGAAWTLVLLVVARRLARWRLDRGHRIEARAALGRLLKDMTHELGNPLGALKGAVQYLENEIDRGGSLRSQKRFLVLLLNQIDRMRKVVDAYTRLGQIQPKVAPTDLNALVRDVIALRAGSPGGIAIEVLVTPGAPLCQVDPTLVGAAVEDLIGSFMASQRIGSTLTVRTAVRAGVGRNTEMSIMVEDTGPGTPIGELGFAFMEGVVQAHGGRVDFSRKPDSGTSVTLTFPVAQEAGN